MQVHDRSPMLCLKVSLTGAAGRPVPSVSTTLIAAFSSFSLFYFDALTVVNYVFVGLFTSRGSLFL